MIARELFMLVASRYALSRGIEIQINWAGRIGVAPIAGRRSSRWPVSTGWRLILLYVGMAFGLTATVLYVRRGAQVRALAATEQDDAGKLSS